MTPTEIRDLCLERIAEGEDFVILSVTRPNHPARSKIKLADMGPTGRILNVTKNAESRADTPEYVVVAAFPAQKMYDFATAVLQDMLTEYVSPCCAAEVSIFKDHLSCAECGETVEIPGI